MYYFRGFHQTPESENPIKFLFKAAIITLVTVSFLSLEEKLREYDTILCIIGGIALIIYLFWIIRNYRKNKTREFVSISNREDGFFNCKYLF